MNAEALKALLQELTSDKAPTMGDGELASHALESRFGGWLTRSKQVGWRYYDKAAHRWICDPDGEDVTAIVQQMLCEMARTEPDAKLATMLDSRVKRDNVLSLLKGKMELRYSGEWDHSEHLIAAPNGVIDLTTGELIPGDPEQRITKAVKVAYDPAATCPRWEQFLSEIFAHDPALPAYVQRLVGYGLTGSTAEQCFAVLFGEGSNGKSTFLTALRRILGEHAVTVPFDMFTVSNRRRGGPETESLVGARLALASETNRSAVLDAAAIKNATGGEEITVDPKFRKPYSFTPEALILLATNYKPVVKEQDEGTWRRIKLIPFLQRFEGARKDMSLDSTLRNEYPGILAWLVRGAVDWYAHGLSDPESVRAAVASYRDESDTLAGFLPGVLTIAPGRWTSNADIWNAYSDWARDNGEESFGRASTLNKALVERSKGAITPKKRNGARGLEGVALASALLRDNAPGIFAP